MKLMHFITAVTHLATINNITVTRHWVDTMQHAPRPQSTMADDFRLSDLGKIFLLSTGLYYDKYIFINILLVTTHLHTCICIAYVQTSRKVTSLHRRTHRRRCVEIRHDVLSIKHLYPVADPARGPGRPYPPRWRPENFFSPVY